MERGLSGHVPPVAGVLVTLIFGSAAMRALVFFSIGSNWAGAQLNMCVSVTSRPDGLTWTSPAEPRSQAASSDDPTAGTTALPANDHTTSRRVGFGSMTSSLVVAPSIPCAL